MKIHQSKTSLIVCTFLSLSMTSANAFSAKTIMTLQQALKVDPNAFTIDMAIERALDAGDITLAIAKTQIEQAAGNFDTAKAQRRPTISGSIGAGANSVRGGSTGSFTNHTASITIPLPFLNHAITANINSASNLELSANQLYLAQVNQAIMLVNVDYYNTKKAEKDIQAAKNLLADSSLFYKRESFKQAGGIGSQQDLLRAKGSVDRAQKALTDAILVKTNSCSALLNLLSLSVVDDATKCDNLVDPSVPARFDIDLSVAVAKAKVSRPEVAANLAQINAYKDQLSGIGGWNNLSAQVGVTNGSPGSIPGSSVNGFAGIDPLHRGNVNTVGATINYTFNMGRDSGRERTASAIIAEATLSLQATINNIESDVNDAKASLMNAYADKATADTTYNDAKSLVSYDDAQVAAGLGTTDSTSYVQDLTNYHQAEQQRFQANCNVAEAIAQLKAAVGAPPLMTVSQFLNSGIGISR